MRAAVFTRYGPPDVVRVADVEPPTVSGGEVLVKVHATTVNRTDCGWRAAKPSFVRLLTGVRRPRRPILGCEFAGEVEALGDNVTSFNVGDRVFGFTRSGFGAHAEYLVTSADGLIATIPASMSFEEAAPSTEGSQYARAFISWARIQRGQDVLVNGATGAIGSAAVQLLRILGANVTAVCATDQVELVKKLGAARVIDYTVDDFTADTQTYDVVVDAVGKSSFARCRRLLRARGVYLSSDLGRLWQNPILALVTPVFGGRRVKFPLPNESHRELASYLKGVIESGEFRPLVDRVYPLDEVVEAYRYVESGRKIGNVVIRVRP